jgi:hypothetical protein
MPQVGDIGKSMIQAGRRKDISCDVQAVCKIANQLLNLHGSSDTTGMSWIMAKSFVTQTSGIDPRTLLKVRKLSNGCTV